MAGRVGHRGFGNCRRLPSKRWQARYRGPDNRPHVAPGTFARKLDAERWLTREHDLIAAGQWTPPAFRAAVNADRVTFATYADGWLAHRKLKPRTREHYRKLLDRHILPGLGAWPLDQIGPDVIRDWHADCCPTTPTMRAHAYSLTRSILATAVGERLIVANPCVVRGAGNAKRASKTEPATLDELAVIVAEVPERYTLMVLLAAWCALRFGELTELRAADVDTRHALIRVRRAVTWVDGAAVVGTPKSDAGTRDVAIPPHLLPVVRAHLARVDDDPAALLFPAAHDTAGHMRPGTLAKVFHRARGVAGRPDLRFHDLRHTGAVLAASTGATLAELMARLGHSTPAAALRYQHAAKGRDAEIAALLSKLAEPDG